MEIPAPPRPLFLDVRRLTRAKACLANVQSVNRILYAIFHRFNLEWA